MDVLVGLIGLVVGIAMVVVTVWREKRPRDGFDVSLIPTTPVMFAGALLAIVSVAYLLHAFGISLPERPRGFN